MSEITVPAWLPRSQHRTDLIAVIPLGTKALNELIDELTRQPPEHDIVRHRHAMAGRYGPPGEALK